MREAAKRPQRDICKFMTQRLHLLLLTPAPPQSLGGHKSCRRHRREEKEQDRIINTPSYATLIFFKSRFPQSRQMLHRDFIILHDCRLVLCPKIPPHPWAWNVSGIYCESNDLSVCESSMRWSRETKWGGERKKEESVIQGEWAKRACVCVLPSLLQVTLG